MTQSPRRTGGYSLRVEHLPPATDAEIQAVARPFQRGMGLYQNEPLNALSRKLYPFIGQIKKPHQAGVAKLMKELRAMKPSVEDAVEYLRSEQSTGWVRRHLAPDSRPEVPVKDVVGRGLHGSAVPGVVPIAAPFSMSSSNLDETFPLLKAEDCGAPVGETTGAGPRGHVSRRFALTLFVVVAGLAVCAFSILPLSLDG